MEAYRGGWEHLRDELDWLDEGLRTLLEIGGGNPWTDPSAPRKGLAVTEAELRGEAAPDSELLTSERWARYAESRRAKERQIAASAEAAMRAGVGLPLAQLCSRLRLTAWERRCVVLALAPELDRRYEKWFGYLNDDVTCKAATPDLAFRLLSDRPEDRRAAAAALGGGRALRRVLLAGGDGNEEAGAFARPRLKTPLRLDDRTVSFLLGTERMDARLSGFAEVYWPGDIGGLPPVPEDDPIRGAWRGWEQAVPDSGSLPFIHLWGQPGGGKLWRLRHLAAARGQRLLAVRLSGFPEEADRAEAAISRVVREALLTGAGIVLEEEYAKPDAPAANRRAWELALGLYASFSRRPLLAWISNVRRLPSELPVPAGAVWLSGEAAPPSAAERLRIWQTEIGDGGADLTESDWREVADKYRLTSGQIRRAWRQAAALAGARGAVPNRADLESAGRGQFRHRLAMLADRMEPARTWGDLVLPAEPLSLLKEACSQYRHRETVYGNWGFGRKLPYGRGLSVLFSGPPGTGKTMAAEIMAADLGLELYRIDLSRIVSKYIGETEQRLSELFAEAEHSGAILFFDEGDALFGKRTEVKDAHDKYANMEAAYLLQRIEAYDGITILATNLLQNMDEALLRRMSYVVKFPFPDAAERERIFRVHLPPGAPLDGGLDFAFLASRLDVSGGYIKNIVLGAAFLAAASGEPIGMGHMVRSARRELQKMGKILVKELFSPYADENSETFG
ncbi:AAA family ATPase [Cohnella caldifontis]|uniref:AAA family ATPase n=1 Tax=Cohnella caldifontis TaxID=3027471 RepID=UPI0023EDF027|nr:ATP-binding protein [Cohnella sp. YIM B05605]